MSPEGFSHSPGSHNNSGRIAGFFGSALFLEKGCIRTLDASVKSFTKEGFPNIRVLYQAELRAH